MSRLGFRNERKKRKDIVYITKKEITIIMFFCLNNNNVREEIIVGGIPYHEPSFYEWIYQYMLANHNFMTWKVKPFKTWQSKVSK